MLGKITNYFFFTETEVKKKKMLMILFFSIMLFIIGLPVVQIILFCLSIGKDPRGLSIAIVNHELNSSTQKCVPSVGCEYKMLSCRYLEALAKRKVVYTSYDNETMARNAVSKGWAWAAITFPANYSSSMFLRSEEGKDVTSKDLMDSTMFVDMDMSSKFLLFICLLLFTELFKCILKNFLKVFLLKSFFNFFTSTNKSLSCIKNL